MYFEELTEIHKSIIALIIEMLNRGHTSEKLNKLLSQIKEPCFPNFRIHCFLDSFKSEMEGDLKDLFTEIVPSRELLRIELRFEKRSEYARSSIISKKKLNFYIEGETEMQKRVIALMIEALYEQHMDINTRKKLKMFLSIMKRPVIPRVQLRQMLRVMVGFLRNSDLEDQFEEMIPSRETIMELDEELGKSSKYFAHELAQRHTKKLKT